MRELVLRLSCLYDITGIRYAVTGIFHVDVRSYSSFVFGAPYFLQTPEPNTAPNKSCYLINLQYIYQTLLFAVEQVITQNSEDKLHKFVYILTFRHRASSI